MNAPNVPYVCPHCGTRQFVAPGRGIEGETQYSEMEIGHVRRDDSLQQLSVSIKSLVYICSRCNEISVDFYANLHETSKWAQDVRSSKRVRVPGQMIKMLHTGRVYPSSETPVVHPSVPAPLAEDYREASLILGLSPKSSAVLARRCVQGALRDFCGIAKDTLAQEINELERRYREGQLKEATPYVSHQLLEVIDGIRSVGNIGAHMEKNVNKVIPIEHDEAKLLLELVGTLFTEWYQAKSERDARLRKLIGVAAKKAAAKAGKAQPEQS